MAEQLWMRRVTGNALPFSVGDIFRDAPMVAAVGAFCGFALGLVLAGVERKRTFESLTYGRFVTMGVASAMVIPATAILVNFRGFNPLGMAHSLAIFGIPGGITAAALLAIARHAPQPVPPDKAPIALHGSEPGDLGTPGDRSKQGAGSRYRR